MNVHHPAVFKPAVACPARAGHASWRAVGLLLLAALSGPAAAQVFTDCGILFSFDGGLGQSSAVCAATASGRGGSASAEASIGTLSAEASVFSSLQHLTQASANATWFDTITVSSPDVEDGTSGSLVFGFYLTGSLSASGHGVATAGLSFGSCSGPALCSPGSGLASAEVTATSGDPVVSTVGDHTVNFRFGEVTSIAMSLVTIARKLEAFEEPFDGSADVNFSSTAYWGGILEVRNGGVSVPFTIETGSGVDLRQSFRPVPVPAAGWLLLSALGVLRLQTGRVRRRALRRH